MPGAFLAFLLWALVAAPTLGLMHRIVHGPHVALGHERAVEAQHHDCDHGHGWIAALFTAHDDDSTCRLLDSLAHADLTPPPAVALVALPPSTVVAALQGLALARWAALFDARGPPAGLR